MMRIGINGFGRIGRGLFRRLEGHPQCQVVAVNDLASATELAHYLRYDSFVGQWKREIKLSETGFAVEGRDVRVYCEESWSQIPWSDVRVELVIEATRAWKSRVDIASHLRSDIDRVVVTANCPEADLALIPGINDADLNPTHRIISAASCTTQCLVAILNPLLKVMSIRSVDYTVIHQVSADQVPVDMVGRGLRKGRSALASAIPIPTTASAGVERILPYLRGRITGLVVRVPITAVSLAFVTLLPDPVGSTWNLQSMCGVLESAQSPILRVTETPLVSVDYVGDTASAVVDITLSRSDSERFLTLGAWFDNEAGYITRVVELIELLEQSKS